MSNIQLGRIAIAECSSLTIFGRKRFPELDIHAVQVSIEERGGIPGAKQTIPVLVRETDLIVQEASLRVK
jgi:hypothetical protein